VQLLLGHTKIESAVRYLGIEIDDACVTQDAVDPIPHQLDGSFQSDVTTA
jgi:hypothetical protein